VVRELEEKVGKKRIRGLYIVKSRGTKHSSDVHKIILSDKGINLEPMDNDSNSSPVLKQINKGSSVKSTKK